MSWYCSGSHSEANESTSIFAIFIAFASGFVRRLGRPSTSARGTTSSAKRIVDMASTPSSGRTAVRYCVLRMTTVPIATRSRSSIAAEQQLVRLFGGVAVGSQPVRALVVDRVDLGQPDEVGDLDRTGRRRPQFVEFLLVERDVAALADLEAQLDVVRVDLLAGLLRHLAVPDARPRLLLQLVEVHVVITDGGERLDLHVHQTEADRS